MNDALADDDRRDLAAAGVEVVRPPSGAPGWASAAALSDPDRLRALVARRGRALGTGDPRVAATFLLESWAWAVLAPAMRALVRHRRVPDGRADAVLLRVAGDGRVGAVCFTGAVTTAEGGLTVTHLADMLRRGVLDGHLGGLAAALAPLSGRGPGALRASVQDVAAAAYWWCAGGRDASVASPPPPGGPLRLVTGPDGRAVPLRRGCCQSFRLGDAPCAGCPRRHRAPAG